MYTEADPSDIKYLFKRSILLSVLFLVLTPLAIGASLLALITVGARSPAVLSASTTSTNLSYEGAQIFASLPSSVSEVTAGAIVADSRAIIVRNYLENYESPLVPYASFIVDTADVYGLDFRLITAIAQQESNLCKKIPPESFNCWGWGIHSEGTLGFDSYEDGITIVTQGLRQEYLDKEFSTVVEIMSKYTPLSDGSWAQGVSDFMESMQ